MNKSLAARLSRAVRAEPGERKYRPDGALTAFVRYVDAWIREHVCKGDRVVRAVGEDFARVMKGMVVGNISIRTQWARVVAAVVPGARTQDVEGALTWFMHHWLSTRLNTYLASVNLMAAGRSSGLRETMKVSKAVAKGKGKEGWPLEIYKAETLPSGAYLFPAAFPDMPALGDYTYGVPLALADTEYGRCLVVTEPPPTTPPEAQLQRARYFCGRDPANAKAAERVIMPGDVLVRINNHELKGCDDDELVAALEAERYPRVYWFLGSTRAQPPRIVRKKVERVIGGQAQQVAARTKETLKRTRQVAVAGEQGVTGSNVESRGGRGRSQGSRDVASEIRSRNESATSACSGASSVPRPQKLQRPRGKPPRPDGYETDNSVRTTATSRSASASRPSSWRSSARQQGRPPPA